MGFGLYLNFLNFSKIFAFIIASSIQFYWAIRYFLKKKDIIYKYDNYTSIIQFFFWY